MIKIIQKIWVLALVALVGVAYVQAQTVKWQDLYTVKKKDTIYGITKKYGISIEELQKANPHIAGADYKLKKGDQLLIPFPSPKQPIQPQKPVETKTSRLQKGTVRVGVMLPLHNVDGDGRRMVEYYRGLLMACDSLRARGLNVDVKAWNVDIDSDIRQSLLDSAASTRDIIFGPLYTKQVKHLGDFCRKNDIRMVIPFSINGDEVKSNPQVFQVYQSQEMLSKRAVDAFLERFPNQHVVFIDCNDTTSRKGVFTFQLRKKLEEQGRSYNITNLKSSEAYFSKAFSRTAQNVVVLNTGRSPELNVALAKLDGLTTSAPSVKVTLFGYTEWLMYTKVYLEYFHKYNAYIPTTFYYNPLSKSTAALESSYRGWFKSDMRTALPRFALTGYDHGRFFIGGLDKYGDKFTGAASQATHTPVQTPLKFTTSGAGGGHQCSSFMLVHYKVGQGMETINY